MKVVVCALAKNEHKYINEWVKHYVDLGVDKIYLYDNDNIDSPNIKDFIDYKYLDKVCIKNIRGVHKDKLQHDIYTDFYKNHRYTFDWCLFVDIDEFLMGITNLPSWLSLPQFKYAKQIRVKWRLFGDDELIERDMSKGVKETFVKPVMSSLNRNLIDKGNLEHQGKMLVRGGLDNVVIRSPHFASFRTRDNVIPSVLPSGKPCFSKVVIKEKYVKEFVYINHYMTKSLKEFIDQKLNRTDAVFGDISIKLDYFWRINNKTQEKIKYLQDMGLM